MGQAVFDFSGTTTVITGGASGIGLTCAELIAKCGGDVVVSASRRPDKTEKALDRIRAASGGKSINVAAFPCEVGTEASVASFFDHITKAGIRIDYLIHSAGVFAKHRLFRSNSGRMGYGSQHQHHRRVSCYQACSAVDEAQPGAW